MKPTSAIITRPIGTSGEALPIIGLGTWQSFDVGRRDAERVAQEEVLAAFVALGGRIVDSSPMRARRRLWAISSTSLARASGAIRRDEGLDVRQRRRDSADGDVAP